MKKHLFSALSFLTLATSTMSLGAECSRCVCARNENLLRRDLFALVNKQVYMQEDVPQKEEVLELLKTLEKNGFVVEEGSDDLRVKYVALQGFIEKTLTLRLERGEITNLVGIIHTPSPATPLCTLPCRINECLLAEQVRIDQDKVWTIYARSQIVRNYLGLGGMLYIAYPKSGYEKRTQEQRSIYEGELANYPKTLINAPLPIEEMDPEMIGATYLFTNRDGKKCAFSIKNGDGQRCAFSIQSKQANDPQALSKWGIWYGALDQKEIGERVDEVLSYVEKSGGPKLQ